MPLTLVPYSWRHLVAVVVGCLAGSSVAQTPLSPSTSVIELTATPYQAGRGNDDTASINAALAAGAASHRPVHMGCGLFLHSGSLHIDSVTFAGSGECTELRATPMKVPLDTALDMSGLGTRLLSMRVTTTWRGQRFQNAGSAAVWNTSSSFVISGIHIVGSGSAGVGNIGATDGVVQSTVVENTLADGIYNSKGSSQILVSGNRIVNPGDDCVSVVSYVGDTSITHDIREENNYCIGGHARGFTVVGGDFVTINGGTVEDVAGSGLYIHSEGAYKTMASSNISINTVVIHNAGAIGHLPCIFVSGRQGYLTHTVSLKQITLDGCRYRGFEVGNGGGPYALDVTLSDSSLSASAETALTDSAVLLTGGVNVQLTSNQFQHFGGYGIDIESGNAGLLKIQNNKFSRTVRGHPANNGTLMLRSSGFTTISGANNALCAPNFSSAASALHVQIDPELVQIMPCN